MYFENRYDAAMQLAPRLEKFRGQDGVVLAVPRGGVPLGYYLARHLNFPLDLLMTKKIGHPLNREFAIGAVGLEDFIIDADETKLPEGYVESEVDRIRNELLQQYRRFMGERQPTDIRSKTVIIVDDGIATGRTILVSIKMLKGKQPAKLVIAVPVASVEAAERISREVDEFICLYTLAPFYSVGQFYRDFSEVDDEAVINLLGNSAAGELSISFHRNNFHINEEFYSLLKNGSGQY